MTEETKVPCNIGVDDAAVSLSVPEVRVDQGIKEPNAVVANSQWKEAADACLIGSSCTLQCALEANGRLDHMVEVMLITSPRSSAVPS